jgi:transposase
MLSRHSTASLHQSVPNITRPHKVQQLRTLPPNRSDCGTAASEAKRRTVGNRNAGEFRLTPSASEQATQSASGKRYLDDFKRDAVRLVTEERYTFQAAAKAVGVSEKSLRDWHAKFAPQPSPCGESASLDELREENNLLLALGR